MEFKSASIQLLEDSGTIVVQNGILIESDRVCAIYNMDEEDFKFIYTTRFELNTILGAQGLRMKDLEEEDERFCSECGTAMDEGFCFESDATLYCSEECLTKVITWDEYLEIHDNGNGDAYWTVCMIVEDMWYTKDLGKFKVLGKYKYLNGNYMV